MQKLERFLPGFNHVLCGKPPKTAFTQYREKLLKLRQSTLSELSSIFEGLIPLDKLSPNARGAHSRTRVYSRSVSFFGFLHQVLSPGMPCREVVRKVQSFCSEKNLPMPDSDNAAYCRARGKLDDELLDTIHTHISEKVQQRVMQNQRWKDRDVKVIDGTGITLPDTVENQKEFPQPSRQLPGCGFPVMKVVACFCLASGALLKWVETELKRHESRIMVKFTIKGQDEVGRVIKVSIKDADFDDAPLEDCIMDVVESIDFDPPQGGGIVIVSYPFFFEPG